MQLFRQLNISAHLTEVDEIPHASNQEVGCAGVQPVRDLVCSRFSCCWTGCIANGQHPAYQLCMKISILRKCRLAVNAHRTAVWSLACSTAHGSQASAIEDAEGRQHASAMLDKHSPDHHLSRRQPLALPAAYATHKGAPCSTVPSRRGHLSVSEIVSESQGYVCTALCSPTAVSAACSSCSSRSIISVATLKRPPTTASACTTSREQ